MPTRPATSVKTTSHQRAGLPPWPARPRPGPATPAPRAAAGRLAVGPRATARPPAAGSGRAPSAAPLRRRRRDASPSALTDRKGQGPARSVDNQCPRTTSTCAPFRSRARAAARLGTRSCPWGRQPGSGRYRPCPWSVSFAHGRYCDPKWEKGHAPGRAPGRILPNGANAPCPRPRPVLPADAGVMPVEERGRGPVTAGGQIAPTTGSRAAIGAALPVSARYPMNKLLQTRPKPPRSSASAAPRPTSSCRAASFSPCISAAVAASRCRPSTTSSPN